LKFSLNGGVQNANEAKAAILYDGPWPTPGHVESRIDATPPCSNNDHAKGGDEKRAHAVGNAADDPQTEVRSSTPPTLPIPCGTAAATAAPVASCGIGQDCIDEGDRLLSSAHQDNSADLKEGRLSSSAEAETEGYYVPIRDSDGMIEGVMIGRAAYNDPWGCLGDADRAVFGEPSNACSSRREVLACLEFLDKIS
jgi:hypothetical protein